MVEASFSADNVDAVMTIFRKFDTNRNGFIEKEELTAILGKVSPGNFSPENINKIIEAADANSDGKIDYQELLSWIFGDGAEWKSAIFESADQIAFPIDDAVTRELTWARTKPAEVAEVLRARITEGHYRGLEYFPPERGGGSIVTKEGVAVVREAIAFLEEQARDPIGGVGMQSVAGLYLAAEDHVADVGQTGTASHASSDGTNSADRVRRYGSFDCMGECLWYGSDSSDARMMVLDLIVDDGVASRGHRLGVYNASYDCVGVAYGRHATFGMMTAMEFARGWTPDDEAISARIEKGPVTPDAATIEAAKAKAETAWSLGTCPICKEPIRGGKVIDVPEAGGKMHADCFACSACSKPLRGVPFRAEGGKIFCTPCHTELHGTKCTACGKGIDGPMCKCALGTFHVECLICSQCGAAIGRSRFSTEGGVLTCSACSGGGGEGRGRSPGPARGPAAARGAAAGKAKASAPAGKAKAKAAGRSPSPAGGRAPAVKAKAKSKSMSSAHGSVVGMAGLYAGLE